MIGDSKVRGGCNGGGFNGLKWGKQIKCVDHDTKRKVITFVFYAFHLRTKYIFLHYFEGAESIFCDFKLHNSKSSQKVPQLL